LYIAFRRALRCDIHPSEEEAMLSNAIQVPQIELVEVPAGEFTMGRLDGYVHSGREDPAHTVALEAYRIGRYPVTNAQYRLFAEDTGHPFQDGKDDHPASGLTWQDAWLFCAWMRYKTGLPYHLPTEAEWEKAATWDPKSNTKQPYPWGDQPDDTRCNVLASGHKGTTPVGMYSPRGDSPYGCADMIGNVDEWCNTAMRAYPYDAGNGCETLGAEGRRAIRGGDWYTISPPSGIRRNAPSDARVGLWGFRVALGDAVDRAQQQYRQRLEAWYRQDSRARGTDATGAVERPALVRSGCLADQCFADGAQCLYSGGSCTHRRPADHGGRAEPEAGHTHKPAGMGLL
jgi:formylglycine-generating enzyme required for sulfatase activity